MKAVLLYLVTTVGSQQSHSHEDLQAQEYIKSCTVAGNDGDQDTSPSHQSMGFCLMTEQFAKNTGKAGAASQLVEHLPTNRMKPRNQSPAMHKIGHEDQGL